MQGLSHLIIFFITLIVGSPTDAAVARPAITPFKEHLAPRNIDPKHCHTIGDNGLTVVCEYVHLTEVN
jgi:hypothetical protein